MNSGGHPSDGPGMLAVMQVAGREDDSDGHRPSMQMVMLAWRRKRAGVEIM